MRSSNTAEILSTACAGAGTKKVSTDTAGSLAPQPRHGPTSIGSAAHYQWGQGCDGWRLLRRPDMTITEEMMPPGAAETPHYHSRGRQFFYVLVGRLTIETESDTYRINAYEGVEVCPTQRHVVRNCGSEATRFLVVSAPSVEVDRIVLPDTWRYNARPQKQSRRASCR